MLILATIIMQYKEEVNKSYKKNKKKKINRRVPIKMGYFLVLIKIIFTLNKNLGIFWSKINNTRIKMYKCCIKTLTTIITNSKDKHSRKIFKFKTIIVMTNFKMS